MIISNLLEMLGALAALFVFVMILSANSANGFSQAYGRILSLPLFGLFTISLLEAYKFGILLHMDWVWALMAFVAFVASVFTFSGVILTSSVVSWSEKGIVIKEKSWLDTLLITYVFTKERPDNLTLCKLSWISVAVLIVSLVCISVVGVACLLILIIVSLVTGNNVLKKIAYFFSGKTSHTMAWQFFGKTKVPKSPLLWVACSTLVYEFFAIHMPSKIASGFSWCMKEIAYGFSWLGQTTAPAITHPNRYMLMGEWSIGIIAIGFVLYFIVAVPIGLKLRRKYLPAFDGRMLFLDFYSVWQEMRTIRPKRVRTASGLKLGLQQHFTKIFAGLRPIWQGFKGKVCPKITFEA